MFGYIYILVYAGWRNWLPSISRWVSIL